MAASAVYARTTKCAALGSATRGAPRARAIDHAAPPSPAAHAAVWSHSRWWARSSGWAPAMITPTAARTATSPPRPSATRRARAQVPSAWTATPAVSSAESGVPAPSATARAIAAVASAPLHHATAEDARSRRAIQRAPAACAVSREARIITPPPVRARIRAVGEGTRPRAKTRRRRGSGAIGRRCALGPCHPPSPSRLGDLARDLAAPIGASRAPPVRGRLPWGPDRV